MQTSLYGIPNNDFQYQGLGNSVHQNKIKKKD